MSAIIPKPELGYDPNKNTSYMYGNAFIERAPIWYGQFPPFINVPYGPHPPSCPGGCYNHPNFNEPVPPNDYYTRPPAIPVKPPCDFEIDRTEYPNIINVQSRLVVTLKIHLFAVNPEDDTDILLENDKKYKIIYLTEQGVKTVTGILKYIDTTISDECVRYIGNSSDVSDYAHIILDCSTENGSDIRKIFIKSLRAIEEIVPEEPENPNDTTGGSETDTGNSDNDNTDTGEDISKDPVEDGGNTDEDPVEGDTSTEESSDSNTEETTETSVNEENINDTI